MKTGYVGDTRMPLPPACARCAALERQRDALLVLFRKRTESDDKTILDDLEIAARLLRYGEGEIGFALCNKMLKFVSTARAAFGLEVKP